MGKIRTNQVRNGTRKARFQVVIDPMLLRHLKGLAAMRGISASAFLAGAVEAAISAPTAGGKERCDARTNQQISA